MFVYLFKTLATPSSRGSLAVVSRDLDAPRGGCARPGPLHAGPTIVEVVLAGVDVLEDTLGDAREGGLDILAALGARLDVLQHAVLLRPLLRLGERHLALISIFRLCAVQFVAHQNHDDVGLGDVPQVVQPVSRMGERRSPRDVEYEKGARCASEVTPRHRFALTGVG